MGFNGSGDNFPMPNAVGTKTDVAVGTPRKGDFFGWDSTIQKWVNSPLQTATGGGMDSIRNLNGTGGTLTIDLAAYVINNANVYHVTLQANTTFAFTGAPTGKACTIAVYLLQDATGGRSVSWPASVLWPGGVAPAISTTASALDLCVFTTLNGGTQWYGVLSGNNFS